MENANSKQKKYKSEATVLATDPLPGETAARLPKLLIRECRMQYSTATGLW